MQYPPNQHNWATDSVCCTVKECGRSWVQHTARYAAVSSQLGTVVYPAIINIYSHALCEPTITKHNITKCYIIFPYTYPGSLSLSLSMYLSLSLSLSLRSVEHTSELQSHL